MAWPTYPVGTIFNRQLVVLDITSNVENFDAFTQSGIGANTPANVIINVDGAAVVGGTGIVALDVRGFDSRSIITINNDGEILGKGGDGGGHLGDPPNPGAGGDAIRLDEYVRVTVVNDGKIFGGGGGGGRGASRDLLPGDGAAGGGGGGGGQGYVAGVGGNGDTGSNPGGSTDDGDDGTDGLTSPNTQLGQPGGAGGTNGAANAGNGGSSGGWGQAGVGGTNGSGGSNITVGSESTSGGAAGKAITGHTGVLLSGTGTEYGTVS